MNCVTLLPLLPKLVEFDSLGRVWNEKMGWGW